MRVLVLGPNAPSALLMMRCVQSLGHEALLRTDVAEAAESVRSEAWDTLVIDLDGLGAAALDAVRALTDAAPRPPRLLGVAYEPAPRDLLEWGAAGVDRLVSLDCGEAWRAALDPRLPSGFDPQPLDRLRELDERVSRDSVHALLDDTPRRIAAIGAALERGDAAEARRPAHALKGGAAQLGMMRVAGLCARIEVQLADERLEAAAETWNLLQEAWRPVASWLERELA